MHHLEEVGMSLNAVQVPEYRARRTHHAGQQPSVT
jgi:hypothetical protein